MPRCAHPLIIRNTDDLFKPSVNSRYRDELSDSFCYRVVPCGKCVSCLKNRQSDFAFRIVREAHSKGSMVFVTFTYRPDTVPFAVCTQCVDKETGDCIRSDSISILESCPLLDMVRKLYDQSVKTNKPFYYFQDIYEDNDVVLRYCLTPSLCRKDFRLWLKRERVRYKRVYGCSLPSFSYACIGEYGPNTVRPHMHCCFMGLSVQQVYRICESWKNDFGFVYVEKVNCVNTDGTSGFCRASRYVSKYLFKGSFDNPAVIAGNAEKGRLCCSLGLGTDLSLSEKDYLLCKDVFGELDFQNIKKINGGKLTDVQLVNFATLFASRSVMRVDGSYYRLPRSVIRRLFYDCVKTLSEDGKVIKVQYKACPLRQACSSLIQTNFLRNYFGKFEQDFRQFSIREDYASLRKMLALKETSSSLEEKSRADSFQRSLYQSKF